MSPRTGRPTNNPKPLVNSFRLTDSDIEKLEFCVKKTGKSKSEIIRQGIDKVYEELKNK